jgi:AcrR family transcriptional regulator
MNTAARREQLRDALIDAAARAIAADGLAGLKARALAEEVGCAVGAIYNVVADLDELVLLANTRTLAGLEAALAKAARPGRGVKWAVEQLTALALAYLEFATAHRLQWRSLFDHRIPRGEETPEWYRRDQERLFAYVERPIAELAPNAAASDHSLLARSLFSAVHGLVALGLEEKLQFVPLPVLRQQITIVVEAIGRGLPRAP